MRPNDERRGAQRKAEENRMLIWGVVGGEFLGCRRFIFEMVYYASNAEVGDVESC